MFAQTWNFEPLACQQEEIHNFWGQNWKFHFPLNLPYRFSITTVTPLSVLGEEGRWGGGEIEGAELETTIQFLLELFIVLQCHKMKPL